MIATKQKEIIEALGVPAAFDAGAETRKRINFLKLYLKTSGLTNYVLGISGGIDSTTAGCLAQIAVNELNEQFGENKYKFIAVRLPYRTQADADDANKAIACINANATYLIDIADATDAAVKSVAPFIKNDDKFFDFQKGNVKARMRMIMQYAVAGFNNGLVIGTDHAAEAVMGFYTKFGDGAADILPLAGLNKRRVRAVASWLGVPKELVYKTPTADLEDDKPQLADEVAFGVTYDQIDDFLEGKEIDIKAASKIISAYTKTDHKRNLPVAYS